MTTANRTNAPRFYRVRVEYPDGWRWAFDYWLTEANARFSYEQWCKRSGKDVQDVELWVRLPDGTERIVNHCSLRTDLRDRVAAPLVVEAEQLTLF